MNLDEIDRLILMELQGNARISNAELARRVNLSPPATLARVKRLEDNSIINKHVSLIDRNKAGYDLLCFVRINLQIHDTDQVFGFHKAIQGMTEVLECHHVTGDHDYLLKILAKNTNDLENFLVNRLTPIPGVAKIHTSLVLREVKNSTFVPIPPDTTQEE